MTLSTITVCRKTCNRFDIAGGVGIPLPWVSGAVVASRLELEREAEAKGLDPEIRVDNAGECRITRADQPTT